MKALRILVLATVAAVALGGVILSLGGFGDVGQALAWARQKGEAPQAQLWTGGEESNLFQQEDKPWLGVLISNLNQRLIDKLGLPAGTTGVVVVRVMPGSPAADKLKKDDVITKLDGTAVNDVKGFKDGLKDKKVGDKVTLTFLRGGQSQTVEVTLGSRPKPRASRVFPFLPELEGIPGEELFSHLIGGQFTLTDKDGKEVTLAVTAGTVVAVAENSITIDPNGPAGNVTYNVTTSTILPGWPRSVASLQAGDPVVIMSKQGSQDALSIMALPRGQVLPHPRGERGQMLPPRMMPQGQGFFPRPGPGPQQSPPSMERFRLRERMTPSASSS